ncbi:hypothetical protein [Actinacidiphila sp. bgisy144]|uniref:hypothetical protein n=1 Tax=Actinacidiphila sp. bgisy144 TaxID=3413791 RepID=UPI003EB9CB3A
MPLPSLSGYGVMWSARMRIAVLAAAVAVLVAVAAAVAWFTGSTTQHRAADPPRASSPVPTSATPAPSTTPSSVAAPPQISEPVAFAEATARMLWSYDTRDTTRDQQLTGMRAWMTAEAKYADFSSVSGQIPDPVLWSRMADQDQHATATITEGHYPSAFKQALADDPSAITEAYIYVVTVNGTQQITWKGGDGGEDRAITLAVQCRPSQDCRLAAIDPTVAQ